ncbi:hypothetical protein Y1Q_0000596 [Alligator mississippiensis]|uniref:Uncharacterized protein n=1 Tax=Alligator mississippiensis TaxID=8496 RepID=A0A151MBR9_ALLMI|nr:hypothetical protein Y1Q_0000596 [Alligator mississippiensis]
MENIVCKEERVVRNVERDWVDQVFQDRFLAFKKRHFTLLERMVEAQKQQATMVARIVGAMEEDHQVLDTIMALAVTFMLSATQLQVFQLAWAGVQQCLQ